MFSKQKSHKQMPPPSWVKRKMMAIHWWKKFYTKITIKCKLVSSCVISVFVLLRGAARIKPKIPFSNTYFKCIMLLFFSKLFGNSYLYDDGLRCVVGIVCLSLHTFKKHSKRQNIQQSWIHTLVQVVYTLNCTSQNINVAKWWISFMKDVCAYLSCYCLVNFKNVQR